jgi:hypothetical protein
MHLWTIQDAKDGDILVCGDNPEIIMLFKSLRNIHWAFTHFHMYNDGDYRVNDWCDCGENVHPATKEQRDLLFNKMKEAGYEWNAKKKELKKIEQGNPPLLSNSSNNGKDEQQPFDYEHANIQQKDFAPKVEPKFKKD